MNLPFTSKIIIVQKCLSCNADQIGLFNCWFDSIFVSCNYANLLSSSFNIFCLPFLWTLFYLFNHLFLHLKLYLWALRCVGTAFLIEWLSPGHWLTHCGPWRVSFRCVCSVGCVQEYGTAYRFQKSIFSKKKFDLLKKVWFKKDLEIQIKNLKLKLHLFELK